MTCLSASVSESPSKARRVVWGGSGRSRGKGGKGEKEEREDDVLRGKGKEEGRRNVQVGKDNGSHHHHR
jgi:hypothetical protein